MPQCIRNHNYAGCLVREENLPRSGQAIAHDDGGTAKASLLHN